MIKDIELRDHFAAKIIQSVFSDIKMFQIMEKSAARLGYNAEYGIFKICYDLADLIIKAREK